MSAAADACSACGLHFDQAWMRGPCAKCGAMICGDCACSDAGSLVDEPGLYAGNVLCPTCEGAYCPWLSDGELLALSDAKADELLELEQRMDLEFEAQSRASLDRLEQRMDAALELHGDIPPGYNTRGK